MRVSDPVVLRVMVRAMRFVSMVVLRVMVRAMRLVSMVGAWGVVIGRQPRGRDMVEVIHVLMQG